MEENEIREKYSGTFIFLTILLILIIMFIIIVPHNNKDNDGINHDYTSEIYEEPYIIDSQVP